MRATRRDEERAGWEGEFVLMPNDVWAGIGRHSAFVELQLDAIDAIQGTHDGVVRFLTTEAAHVLGCQLLLAAIAGDAYTTGKGPNIGADRLSAILQRILVELDAEMDRGGEAT